MPHGSSTLSLFLSTRVFFQVLCLTHICNPDRDLCAAHSSCFQLWTVAATEAAIRLRLMTAQKPSWKSCHLTEFWRMCRWPCKVVMQTEWHVGKTPTQDSWTSGCQEVGTDTEHADKKVFMEVQVVLRSLDWSEVRKIYPWILNMEMEWPYLHFKRSFYPQYHEWIRKTQGWRQRNNFHSCYHNLDTTLNEFHILIE